MPLEEKIWFIRAHKFNVFIDGESITCRDVEIVQEPNVWLAHLSRGVRADEPMLSKSFMDDATHDVIVEVYSDSESNVRGHRCTMSQAKAVKHVVNPSAEKNEVLVEAITFRAAKPLFEVWDQIG